VSSSIHPVFSNRTQRIRLRSFDNCISVFVFSAATINAFFHQVEDNGFVIVFAEYGKLLNLTLYKQVDRIKLDVRREDRRHSR
jgi:hypothetical protein